MAKVNIGHLRFALNQLKDKKVNAIVKRKQKAVDDYIKAYVSTPERKALLAKVKRLKRQVEALNPLLSNAGLDTIAVPSATADRYALRKDPEFLRLDNSNSSWKADADFTASVDKAINDAILSGNSDIKAIVEAFAKA